jgi:hypothetical protein
MWPPFTRLWDNDLGHLLAVEWTLIASVLALGAGVGFVVVRQVVLGQ